MQGVRSMEGMRAMEKIRFREEMYAREKIRSREEVRATVEACSRDIRRRYWKSASDIGSGTPRCCGRP